ncbi:hypothetical protein H3146_03850 [Streptomyces sp. OF3]|uniref:DUF2690 domain-containing protein n=2 Tax=Streptomyces alkaliterrae TaxID=2213162 RepID=A0A5P0YVI4_9ACTN|nr:hypothetical protein [Streptomyces alkaliterrae]MBB1262221.1 hypothetical protein [Streptomyces alkaliterrae]MQS04303.1 hypothetical protein [Streptomyces alkaliterrae]
MAGTANAAPSSSPGYPRFTHEGKYPQNTPCSGSYQLKYTNRANVGGRTITLKYFYAGGCGSFARIENAPRGCYAWLDRTRERPSGTPTSWDWVRESVDPGIDYAYTQVGNNLSGRVSRAALVCGTTVHSRTPWY